MSFTMPVTIEGVEYQARQADFEPAAEPWAEYRLLDGGKVRMRICAQEIFWLYKPDGSRAFYPNGVPMVYITQAIEIVARDGV